MEMQTLKLKRHETFSIREGWIEKGLNIIKENPDCFKKNDGPINFGLGTNMCKSLKYWLLSTNVAEFTNQGAFLTSFGELLFKYDKYLENIFSWWIMHINLITNFNDAPIFCKIFNANLNQFEKESLFAYLKSKLSEQYIIGADSSLESDITVALKSYCADVVIDPENNLQCPFARLGLFSINGKMYYKNSPSYYSLDYRVVYWSLIKCLEQYIKNNQLSFNIEDIYMLDNNPIKLFNISKSSLFVYLEEMKKNGLIIFTKTAGLNTVRFDKILTLEELFASYYGGF